MSQQQDAQSSNQEGRIQLALSQSAIPILRYMHMPIKVSVELPTNHVASYPASRTDYPPPRIAVVMQSHYVNGYLHLLSLTSCYKVNRNANKRAR
jgi:hypothetical protein